MTEIRRHYYNILTNSISNLEKISDQDVGKCKLCNARVVSCNSTKENITGQNAAACKWSNATAVTCSSDKERAIYCMARCLKRLSRTSTSQLKDSIEKVSNETMALLRKIHYATTAQNGRCCQGINSYKKSNPICCIRKIVSDLRACWTEFVT